MNAFAALLDRLSTTAGRKDKLALIQNWLATTPDPDRGYGLAALTGDLSFRHAKAGVLRSLITERSDPTLFALSYDYVGDLAETVALLWPSPPTPQTANTAPSLSNVVERLQTAGRTEVPGLVSAWLDSLDEDGRWALLKLLTGGLRVGVSARLARLAFADWAGKPIEQVEEAWHGHAPPYDALFAWAMGTGPAPDSTGSPAFRPFMLAHPMEPGDQEALDPKDCLIEWKWDGIRAQLADASGGIKLFSRTGDDLCAAFPDLVEALRGIDATVDGELLVRRAHPLDETDDGAMPASFNALQQRLNRKTVPAKMLRDSPALLRVYDLLIEAGEDLRPLPLSERRKRLEVFVAQNQDRAPWLDLSEPVSLPDWAAIEDLKQRSRALGREGLMVKRLDSPYLAGRIKGPWFKLKRDPLLVDAVLLYAQRGHGKRSSLYSDFTFGVWQDDRLVTVGKAYFGFTDAELAQLDRWVRDHTVDRYGPVRAVEPGLVLEIAFDSIHRSKRHKSGLAMRFPRIHRLRWDKPAAEADHLETLDALVAD